jgi:hypothetical protein
LLHVAFLARYLAWPFTAKSPFDGSPAFISSAHIHDFFIRQMFTLA